MQKLLFSEWKHLVVVVWFDLSVFELPLVPVYLGPEEGRVVECQ